MGPFHSELKEYKKTHDRKQDQSFQYSWFSKFPWLEYSVAKDKKWKQLEDPSQHIDNVMRVRSSQQVSDNRLRLKTSIETVRWLAKQACVFRAHDESGYSSNRGKFLEMVKFLATMNEDIHRVCLDNAPKNSRFVDCHGIIREHFFDVIGVHDTTTLTLKENITSILTRYDLQIENMRGQRYDGASNMCDAWNGLQALFLNECPSAYYVHCFAHRLQLASVASSKDVHDVWLFFSKLNSVVNFVNVSPKCHFELRSAQKDEITDRLASGQLESGIGTNQMRSLTRPGATRWSSHYFAVSRVIDMFDSTCKVLENTM
ncbi:hypothetical protein PTKIN_Ptkin18bG0111000 [Pterospermum kingtungense]